MKTQFWKISITLLLIGLCLLACTDKQPEAAATPVPTPTVSEAPDVIDVVSDALH